jgi:hypothetical protein
MRATPLAALCEVVFACLVLSFALGLPSQPSGREGLARLVLCLEGSLALLAAVGVYRSRRWGWLVALGLAALALGPMLVTIFQAWRAGVGVAVALPASSVALVAAAWVAQLIVLACFFLARGWRPRV